MNRVILNVDLKMNRKQKTNVMFNCNVLKKTIWLEDEDLKEVQKYIYFGQVIILRKYYEHEINVVQQFVRKHLIKQRYNESYPVDMRKV